MVHPLGHEGFDVPVDIPTVVRVDEISGGLVCSGSDSQLVVGGKVALARNMGKEMRDVAEIRSLWTNAAVQRESGGCHCQR